MPTFLIPKHPEADAYQQPPTWMHLSPRLQTEFSMNFTIPVRQWYIKENNATHSKHTWERSLLLKSIQEAEKGGVLENVRSYSAGDVQTLYRVLEKYPLNGKDVLVIGSQRPWIEVIAVARQAKSVTTVDFNPPDCGLPEKIKCLTVDELNNSEALYDVIISFSSIEHDGLGRYGDPIHPNGDILRMDAIASFMRPNALFILGVPIGTDLLVFNAHRVYGRIRFPLLIQSYESIDVFWNQQYSHITKDNLFDQENGSGAFHPLWVLRKK